MSPIYPAPADGTIYETDDGHGIVVEDGRIRMVDPASASVASVPVPNHPIARRAIVVNLATALGFDPPSLRPNIDVGDRVVVYIGDAQKRGHVAAIEDPYVWILRDDAEMPHTVHGMNVVLEERATDSDESERCTCATDDDWCGDADPDSELICSRPPGHDGPHVACVPAGAHTLETWPETDP